LHEQKQIGEIFSALDKKIELNKRINQNLPTLDRSSEEVEVHLAV
jgi:restriction endonuclease S subunit